MRRRTIIAALGGTAAMLPFAVHAQSSEKRPRIGILWHAANAKEESPFFESLLEGFQDLGYVDGRTISLDHRFPNEMPELFASMAAELVSSKPDVLVGVASAAPYLKKATATIPIVFMYVPEPIGSGLVETIRRPGGNATGLTNFSVELSAKRLEYLKEIDPALARVALLVNPNVKIASLYVEQSNAASAALGLTTQAFEVRTLAELEPAFDAMKKAGMQAVVVNADSLLYQGKEIIAKLAIARHLPTCVYVREVAAAGGLMSYGTDQRAIARRVAVYVDRILKGEKPSDMPVEQPTTFELVINLKTAKALELVIPPTLLARADDVIE